MIDIKVQGADDFLRLSKALKAAGEKDLRKGLHKGLRQAVAKHKPTVAEGLAAVLPSALSGRGTNVKQAIQVKTGTHPGVTVGIRYGKAGRSLGASNAKLVNQRGLLRHPMFGSGKDVKWVNQSIGGSEWFDDGWRKVAPELREQLMRVLDEVAEDVIRKAR